MELGVYRAVGGQAFFDDLVERFYARVEGDPVLRPLYPADLSGPKAHLALFLGQYWGGPSAYSEQRGHPMLRRRHFPFAIGPAERDAWFGHMAAAVRESGLDPATEARFVEYFEAASTHLVNQGG
ncbi:MAG: globin [Acidimicrobiales bacterium]